ncbi:MAG TPA: molybdopterin-binding protein, partial [Bacteroidales bacterium]|nr:molybdopterin-binding protein [Bacteroidales bacterium]
ADNDVILITGGVSMGDYDYVPDVLQEAGFTFHFKSVAMQPGRPTLFASHKSGKFCFGLPGNPVSSFNQFELLVKPLLYKMMEHDYKPVVLQLPLAKDFYRKKSKRLNFIPVLLNSDGEALPVEYHGSAHINSLNDAYGLMSIPIGTTEIKKGDIVNVRPV